MMNDITMRRAIKWSAFSKSDVGCVREVNEDATLSRTEIGLWAVADGMGGYEAGDIASGMVVDALSEIEDEIAFNTFIDSVEDKLLEVNKHIQEYASVMCDNKIMGSTVVSLVIRGRLGACLWAGDSRLYRYRNGELQQLSQDHSQVEELIQQGFLKREDAINHPETNVITRAIGACEEVFIALNVFSTQIGDTYLLCSDGLYNSITDDNLVEFLSLNNAEESTSKLLSIALENNASDNVSLIIIRGEADKIENNNSADEVVNNE